MRAQDVAGEVERAADQDVVRAAAPRRRSRATRVLDRAGGGAPGRRAGRGRGRGLAGRGSSGSPGTGTKRRLGARAAAAGRGSWPRSLVVSMPTTRCSGAAAGEPGQALGQHLRRRPGCGRRRARARAPARQPASTSGPRAQPLQPGRPARLAQARGRSPRSSRPASPSASAAIDGEAGIVDLVHAGSAGRGRSRPRAGGLDRAARPPIGARPASRGRAPAAARRSRPRAPRSPPAPRAAAARSPPARRASGCPAFSHAICASVSPR